MKSLNFNKLNIQNMDILSKTQMKNILGGHDGGNCPPDTFGCLCTDGKGNYGDPIDANGQNILEATNNAADVCESMGWAGAHCNGNWNC